MAASVDREFTFAVKHALSCLNKDDLVLKQEQLDTMQRTKERTYLYGSLDSLFASGLVLAVCGEIPMVLLVFLGLSLDPTVSLNLS